MKLRRTLAAAELLVLLLTALFLFLSLTGEQTADSPVRRHIVQRGSGETGVVNLVTSIYLGYRAFDTLGETAVLLVAVTGVVFFLKTSESRDEEDYDT
ncbi:MAG: hypothetical protein GF388_10240 [Candidatus Aegiribacteria sp.]|nr:hypothetical protein [Candidatus Aegiribacteria sp.]MBD3295412.1 hypothetical protein [Candidatus Fermentibacteria bacterium]